MRIYNEYMANSVARIRANEKYDKLHTVQKKLKLNKNTDADILEYLANEIDNFQGYVKDLIRADMRKKK